MTQSETLAETMIVTRHVPRPSRDSRPTVGRRIVATIAAAATALGLLAATAIPARADNDDLAKALAALAIVGIIASQANKNRQRAQPVVPHQPYQPQPVRHPRVPSVCAIEIAGNSGTATVYGERCMRQQRRGPPSGMHLLLCHARREARLLGVHFFEAAPIGEHFGLRQRMRGQRCKAFGIAAAVCRQNEFARHGLRSLMQPLVIGVLAHRSFAAPKGRRSGRSH